MTWTDRERQNQNVEALVEAHRRTSEAHEEVTGSLLLVTQLLKGRQRVLAAELHDIQTDLRAAGMVFVDGHWRPEHDGQNADAAKAWAKEAYKRL